MEQLGFGEYRVNRQKKTIKTKEKPLNRGAVSRVETLLNHGWEYGYIGFRVQFTKLRFTTDTK